MGIIGDFFLSYTCEKKVSGIQPVQKVSASTKHREADSFSDAKRKSSYVQEKEFLEYLKKAMGDFENEKSDSLRLTKKKVK